LVGDPADYHFSSYGRAVGRTLITLRNI
jgi:hypothetical protein